MGLLFNREKRGVWAAPVNPWAGLTPSSIIPNRSRGNARPYITDDTAMRHSAVWAAIRLRADLISTLPVDVYRLAGGIQVEAPKPPILVTPGGDPIGMNEWVYMSQQELDRSGNSIGLITSVNAMGLPNTIELKSSSSCTVIGQGNKPLRYRIDGKEYDASLVWHERQYSIAGAPVGLSPVAYAAFTLGQHVSVQDFVTSWFSSGATPRARLTFKEGRIDPVEATVVKESWRASQEMSEPFVHGSDWEYALIQAEQASADWLEALRMSVVDVARFFGVPADLIDGAVSGQSITYSNISQRNLQFLVMHLGPAIIRREEALSRLLPRPRYVKFNSDALLRMDPETRAQMLRSQIASRQLAPSEARALENRPPFTDDQKLEFGEFWPLVPPKKMREDI